MKRDSPQFKLLNSSLKKNKISLNYFGTPKNQAKIILETFKKAQIGQSTPQPILTDSKPSINQESDIEMINATSNRDLQLTSLQSYLSTTKNDLKNLSVIQQDDKIYVLQSNKPPLANSKPSVSRQIKNIYKTSDQRINNMGLPQMKDFDKSQFGYQGNVGSSSVS
ncbi:UNKNOWN [Stylonychia lemnae]|uniref:Uncharacterized protein n=1 Tax=Stylonychia lemnae TaxID=5949 RepID=A0A078B774_STYLE|nr:UNKNOWN [Stylonychia lemnae]|eukprot:CDW89403.1 UNKNOWN [Stylonychia lemnae]